MSVTAENLISAIRYVLDEQGFGPGGIMGDLTNYAAASDEAKKMMNWGYADVLRRLPRRNTEHGISTGTVSTTADTENIALTGLNIQWVRDVEGGWASGSDPDDRYRIHIIDRPLRVYHYEAAAGLDVPKHRCWFDYSTDPIEINILPIPTESKTNDIKIWYWPKGYNLLTAANSTIAPFLEEYEELIGLCAAERGLGKKGRALTPMQLDIKARLLDDLDQNLGMFTRQRPRHAIYRGTQGFD